MPKILYPLSTAQEMLGRNALIHISLACDHCQGSGEIEHPLWTGSRPFQSDQAALDSYWKSALNISDDDLDTDRKYPPQTIPCPKCNGQQSMTMAISPLELARLLDAAREQDCKEAQDAGF